MLNISIVLYNTPISEIERLIAISRDINNLHKLYLIDNSPCRSVAIENKLVSIPNSEYIFNGKNLGYGRAHNIALNKSITDKIDYHLVVNADVEFSPAVIRILSDIMNNDRDIALLSPKTFYPDGEIQYLCKLLPTPIDMFGRRFLPARWIAERQEKYELRQSGYNRVMNIPYLSGCFMFLRVDALREVGLFDERYFMYPEDIDLTRRLHRRYKTLFYPDVSIIHHHERASYKSLRMTLIHIWNMCRYFNKWGWFCDHERTNVNKKVFQSAVIDSGR